MLNIALLEKNLETKTFPCGGANIYIDVPSEEALLPPPLPYVCAGVPEWHQECPGG